MNKPIPQHHKDNLKKPSPTLLYIYTVKDNKTGLFGPPFSQPHPAQVVRTFTHEVNKKDTNNLMREFPHDYTLYALGTFNQDTAEYTIELEQLVTAAQILKE